MCRVKAFEERDLKHLEKKINTFLETTSMETVCSISYRVYGKDLTYHTALITYLPKRQINEQ